MNTYHFYKLISMIRLKEKFHITAHLDKSSRYDIAKKLDLSIATCNRIFNEKSPFRHSFDKRTLDKLSAYILPEYTWSHFSEENPTPFSKAVPKASKNFPALWQKKIINQVHAELNGLRGITEYSGSSRLEIDTSAKEIAFKEFLFSYLQKKFINKYTLNRDVVIKGRSTINRLFDFSIVDKDEHWDNHLLTKVIYQDSDTFISIDLVEKYITLWRDIGRGRLYIIGNKNFSSDAVKIAEQSETVLGYLDTTGLNSVIKMHEDELIKVQVIIYSLLPYKCSFTTGSEELRKEILYQHFETTSKSSIDRLAISFNQLFYNLKNNE